MIRIFLILLTSIYLSIPLSAYAQVRGDEISVMVSPDHKNWQYTSGEKCKFKVCVYKAQNLLDNAVIDYNITHELTTDSKKTNVILKNGEITLESKFNKPGFVRCNVTVHVNGNKYSGSATAGYDVDKIKSCAQMPDDFAQFWQDAITKAREVPLEPKFELLESSCTDKVNVYQVSFQNIRQGSRTYGILCIPKKEGKYPALIRVPGAGVRAYYGDISTASKGAITLEIGVHGVPVNMSNSFYDQLARGPLCNYWLMNTDNRDANYYKRVFIGAVRAVDFIYSLKEFNQKELGVTGSSQGGALSFVTSALDNRVTFIAAVHPAMCDHLAPLHNQPGGWPGLFMNNRKPTENQIKASQYYDSVNFAKLLKIPGWYSWGYNDNVCAPTSMYAAYNSITAPKELHLYLQTGHFWYSEQYAEWNKWLWKQLGL